MQVKLLTDIAIAMIFTLGMVLGFYLGWDLGWGARARAERSEPDD